MEASRNPYVRTGTEPALMPSVVAYVDILGYREMALKAEREKQELEFLQNLHQAFSKTQKWLRGGDLPVKIGLKDFYAFRAFTDNVVIGYPIGGRGDAEVELGSIFLKLGIFQFEMTVAGFFVRGAISIGDVYIDDIVVFGKGFTEAYEGESRLARDPRIVLAASASEAVKKHLEYYSEPRFAWQYQDIYSDSDGQLFLNYLDCILIAGNNHGPFYEELEKHRQIIEQRLRAFEAYPEIWSKYMWSANYHNFFCSQYPKYFDKSHMIDLEKFQLRPSRIA